MDNPIIENSVENKVRLQNSSGIYKISFPCGCFYIGSAVNLRKRNNNHLYDLRKNKHCNIVMQRHYIKYGFHGYVFELIESVEKLDYLISREQFYIDNLKPNINVLKVAGSSLGYKHSLEVKEKLRVISNNMVKDNDYLDKISKGWFKKGSKLCSERLSRLQYRMKTNNPFKGKKHNIKTRNLMSLKAKLRVIDKDRLKKFIKSGIEACKKPIEVTENGVKTVYYSITDFEKYCGYKNSNGGLRRKLLKFQHEPFKFKSFLIRRHEKTIS